MALRASLSSVSGSVEKITWGQEHDISAVCISRGVLLWISSDLEDQSLGLDGGGWSAFGVLRHVSPHLAGILQDHPVA